MPNRHETSIDAMDRCAGGRHRSKIVKTPGRLSSTGLFHPNGSPVSMAELKRDIEKGIEYFNSKRPANSRVY